MHSSGPKQVSYWEMLGGFDPAPHHPAARHFVHLSNIDRCDAEGGPFDGLCVRYVARGEEHYRIDGRSYTLKAGQLFVSTQARGAQVEITRREIAGTLGLCVFLGGVSADWLPAPLVRTADRNALGAIMERGTRQLWVTNRAKDDSAGSIVDSITAELPCFANEILSCAGNVAAAKSSTRGEMIRRAYLAQSLLHDTLDRPVELDELARMTGVSPFVLLRNFQHCFGETPASYHRKLRLSRTVEEASRRGNSISAVCDEFGFSGISSFSHAYRRAFGRNWRGSVPETLAARESVG